MFTEDMDEPVSLAFSHIIVAYLLLFGCFAIALICYIWAFCSQSHKLPAFKNFLYLSCVRRTNELQGTQNIYYSAFSLLICDGLTLIFGLVWGILLLSGNLGIAFMIFVNIWVAFRQLSQSQHMITALVSIIFAYHPSWGNGLRSISHFLNLLPFILIILSFKVHIGIVMCVDVYNFLVFVGIVVFLCLPTSSPIADQRKPFGLLSISFYFIICLPSVVTNLMVVRSELDDPYQIIFLVDKLFMCFTNFYIIMNALLFRMVLKVQDVNQSDDPQYECAIRSA